jgi:pyridoxal phosphate enzyme (YggS family)
MEKSLADSVLSNLSEIKNNIEKACIRSGRNVSEITIMAVTKIISAEIVNIAIDNGITLLGENRAQELLEKYEDYHINKSGIHFIGHLQTNKVRQIIDKVSMIESVDSVHLAEEINRCAVQRGITMDILTEVNIAEEQSKSGVSLSDLDELIDKIHTLKNLRFRGIMVIPPVGQGTKYFEAANKLLIDIKGKKLDNNDINILSMGMSSDYAEAVECGSTIVRIGRSLFGERVYRR